jgi:hypothetical protein
MCSKQQIKASINSLLKRVEQVENIVPGIDDKVEEYVRPLVHHQKAKPGGGRGGGIKREWRKG